MGNKKIRCILLGAREKDLPVLSELHKNADVVIECIFDWDEGAVGIEIGEILGIPGATETDQLPTTSGIDYIIVSSPRSDYIAALDALASTEAKILTSSEALKTLGVGDTRESITGEVIDTSPTMENTLDALEKLLDRGELMKFLLDVAVKATSAGAGSIMMYSSEAKELHIGYATGLSERIIKNTRQKLGVGIAGGVAQNKEAKLIQKPAQKDLYAKDRERMDIRSAICVPLLWEGQLLGVLNVSTVQGKRELDNEDLSKLKKLSRRLSRVLSESLKLQEIQVRHRESKFRSTISEVSQKSISTQEKLSALSRYLSELMSADTVEIYMNTREGAWFVLGGSNRLLSPSKERIRCQHGALSRTFLEKRCIIMTEGKERESGELVSRSSVVYCYLTVTNPEGVVVLEFTEHERLDEFLIVKDEVISELSRFIGSELRERRLRRELETTSKISDAAAALLSCRSISDLASVLSRVVADVVECRRVSVRLRRAAKDRHMIKSFHAPPDDRSEAWKIEDEESFARLAERGEAFSLCHLNFEPDVRAPAVEYHSMLAFPIQTQEKFIGGVVAYDKHPGDVMEDAMFSDLDEAMVKNLTSMILPVVETLHSQDPSTTEPANYGTILEGNRQRFDTICTSEVSRSERYHHSFSVILFQVIPLDDHLKKNPRDTLAVIDEITKGIRTRTRKTDYGTWIEGDTYAMISLDGGRRMRFLVSRIMTYLKKDLAQVKDLHVDPDEILCGTADYPGKAKNPAALLAEARANLKPYTQK